MKDPLKNLLLTLSSLVVFIFLAEVITRLLWSPAGNKSKIRKGIVMDGTSRSVEYEGIEYKVNSQGIRNKELPKFKTENTFRIIALGDSYIWGDGLPEEKLITVKLENHLKDRTDKNIEVINAGIGAFNTQDEYFQLLRLFPTYNPDVIIQFFFTNDLLSTNNQNIIDDWKVNTIMWLRYNSKFFSFLYYLIKSKISRDISVPNFLLPNDYFNIDDSKSGWVNFKKYTLKIKEYCDINNLSYCFVLIPTLTTLRSNYPYKEVNDKVTDYVETLGAPFLSYFNLFSYYEPIELWVSKENTHWNELATSLAADTLARFLIEQNLVKRRN